MVLTHARRGFVDSCAYACCLARCRTVADPTHDALAPDGAYPFNLGDRSIAIVKENPYQLAIDIFGIGLRSADKIAGQLGISPTSPQRAEAGVLHVLATFSDETPSTSAIRGWPSGSGDGDGWATTATTR